MSNGYIIGRSFAATALTSTPRCEFTCTCEQVGKNPRTPEGLKIPVRPRNTIKARSKPHDMKIPYYCRRLLHTRGRGEVGELPRSSADHFSRQPVWVKSTAGVGVAPWELKGATLPLASALASSTHHSCLVADLEAPDGAENHRAFIIFRQRIVLFALVIIIYPRRVLGVSQTLKPAWRCHPDDTGTTQHLRPSKLRSPTTKVSVGITNNTIGT